MEPTMVQLTRCPACGSVAEIERRTVLESTDGPIEHVKIRCIERHWSLVPVQLLADAARPVTRRPPVTERR